ncbi:MAG: hypothetical protein ABSA83_15325 [Verrucomicrobiota bacterium]|jgi:hypothetical protein
MKLREVFQHAKRRTLPKKWLYLPAEADWTLDTDGILLDWEKEEKDADEVPFVAKKRNLREALDGETIEDVIGWADRLAGREDNSARLEVFKYYLRFDAFPDRLGAPDPPPAAENLLRIDRQFYDSLGPESAGAKCRHEGCNRGTTKFSVFCRVHQFERVKKKPCPFHH